ncbi:MAG: RNA polymerase sigma factor [Pseudorhizobium sp.]
MTHASTAPVDIRREFVTFLPRLRRFALTLTPGVDEADELVRAACSRAIVEGYCPTSEHSAAPWLFRLIRKTSSETTGRQKTNSPTRRTASKPGTEQQNTVQVMPQGQASVFLLVEIEGFSYDDTADILGISSSLVAMHLCDARQSFAAIQPTASERRA